MKNQDLVERIIEFSRNNLDGFLLSTEAIEVVLKVSDTKTSMEKFNELLKEHETDSGYTVNASIFIDALRKEKKEPNLHRKEITRYLEYEFTKKELAEIAMSLARKTRERQQAEDQKKSANSQFKSEIDKLTAEINLMSGNIVTGSEMRNVKCEAQFFYDDNKKTITRLDTGEVIWDDKIPDGEQQIEMDLSDQKEEIENMETEPGEIELISKSEEIPIVDIDKQIMASGEQSPLPEPSDMDTEEKAADDAQMEEVSHETVEEQQAELDAEDEKVKEKILTESEKADLFTGEDWREKSNLPKAPNE